MSKKPEWLERLFPGAITVRNGMAWPADLGRTGNYVEVEDVEATSGVDEGKAIAADTGSLSRCRCGSWGYGTREIGRHAREMAAAVRGERRQGR